GGAKNLRTVASPFHRLYMLEATADDKSVRLSVDGKSEGSRPKTPGPVSLDEITVGARYYNNAPGPQPGDGFCRCDVAEVLVHDRVLTTDESKQIRSYLDAKYATLKDALPPDAAAGTDVLVPVKDPSPVQVLMPGFTVRELPVDLTNINNVRARP